MRNIFLLSFWLSIQLCHAQSNERSYVLLVSFDGFRSDYVEKFNLTNFKSFIRQGVKSEGLIPSFPSKTFPNHYTIVTGLYPGHHGLVDNTFYDPAKEVRYSMSNRAAVMDSSYYGGVPIWILAKRNGIKTASYFWVGSELESEHLHPDYYYVYNSSVPYMERIDQVIRWLEMPEQDRPQLITLYFSSPDSESHQNGPFHEITKKTVIQMDSLLGVLMTRVKATQLPVNTVVVSDHGMLELVERESTFIFLEDLISSRTPGFTVANGGTQAHIYSSSIAKRDSLYKELKKKEGPFRVFLQDEFPERWQYKHERSGDILIQARPGTYIISGDRKRYESKHETGKTFGAHGYDPGEVIDMRGIFYAMGPGICEGVTLPAFENIHVYPFLAKLLGLECPPIDGNPEATKDALKK